MRFARYIPLVLLAATVAGCSAVPFQRPELVATRPVAVESLLDGHWLLDSGVFRLRQSGLFQLGWKKVPVEGVAQLDTAKKTVRLVAMNAMGVKLFDLQISAREVETHHLLPQFAQHPRFVEAVATSVRRIFLEPQPRRADRLERAADRYVVRRRDKEQELRFVFGSRQDVLLETRSRGRNEDWQVRYYEYRRLGEQWVPGGIVLEDDAAGYRLTLWIEGIKRIHG